RCCHCACASRNTRGHSRGRPSLDCFWQRLLVADQSANCTLTAYIFPSRRISSLLTRIVVLSVGNDRPFWSNSIWKVRRLSTCGSIFLRDTREPWIPHTYTSAPAT